MFRLTGSLPLIAKASIVIKRPPDEIFRFIGEEFFLNYPKWSPEVQDLKQLSDGPVREGTLARQVRVDQGHRTESTFKVTIFDPAKRICFEGVSDPYRCEYELESASIGPSTKVTFIFELKELELPIRPFEKLIRLVIQDGAERTVRSLRRLIESEALHACEEKRR